MASFFRAIEDFSLCAFAFEVRRLVAADLLDVLVTQMTFLTLEVCTMWSGPAHRKSQKLHVGGITLPTSV